MPKVMTRPDFDALDVSEQGAKIREGFTIVDVKPTPKASAGFGWKTDLPSDFNQLENSERWVRIRDGYTVVD